MTRLLEYILLEGYPTVFVFSPTQDGVFPKDYVRTEKRPGATVFSLIPTGGNKFEVHFVDKSAESRALNLVGTFINPIFINDAPIGNNDPHDFYNTVKVRENPIVELQPSGDYKVVKKGLYCSDNYSKKTT